MEKWYDNSVKEIYHLGNKIFIYDPHNLLKDLNFYNELSKTFVIHEYKSDGDLYKFYYENNENKIIVFSKNKIQLGFINRNFNIKEIRINDVFKDLDEKLLKEIDITYYQKFFNYYNTIKSQGRIIETEDILLRSIWDIDLGKLYSPTSNLKIAFSYIIDNKDIPEKIIKSVSEKLSIDLKKLKQDKQKFVNFIQKINSEYITASKSGNVSKYNLKDDMIQIQMIKTILKYDINTENIYQKYPLQIKETTKENNIQKIHQLIKLYNEEIKIIEEKEFDFNDIESIFKTSKLFFEIIYLIQYNELKIEEYLNIEKEYETFDKILRKKLINIIDNNYERLFLLPYEKTPISSDKILDYICKTYKNENIALIIMDGMSYDEWFILKNYLKDFQINEQETFTILPTITSFSRTAILSGKTPNEFMDEKLKFNEKQEFYKSLEKKGFDKNNILYGHLDLKNNQLKTDNQLHHYNTLKNYDFLAIICNLFDEISHEKILTKNYKSSIYKKIKHEVQNSTLIKFLKQLKEYHYTIILTTDHGNIFCKGNGIIPNKNLQIDTKSKRCLLYDKEILAEKMTESNPEKTFIYKYQFIPKNLHILFPTKNECFINENDYKITHGGISPEELIIPLVILR
jgi:hypothetical protein